MKDNSLPRITFLLIKGWGYTNFCRPWSFNRLYESRNKGVMSLGMNEKDNKCGSKRGDNDTAHAHKISITKTVQF